MKTIVSLLLAVCSLAMLSGCAIFWPPPKVVTDTKIIKDENGKVVSSEHTRHIEGRYHNDPETAQSWAEADNMARTGKEEVGLQGQNRRFLEIYNNTSKYIVEILSEPFAGTTLTPGEKTKIRKPFSIGLYKLVYNECRVGSQFCTERKVNIAISSNRTQAITIVNE